MGFTHLLATVLALVAVSNANEMVMVANSTYAMVKLNGETQISKIMNITEDKNFITFAPTHVKDVNDTSEFTDTSIAGMNFTLTAAADVTEGVASKRVVGEMTVNQGTLNLWVDIFTAGGNITIDGETTVVMKGDLRITLALSGYSFDEASTMLKIMFNIKGTQDPEMVSNDDKTDGVTYDLGNDGMARLSEKGKVGDNYVAMMPMVDDETVTIVFNKSTDAFVYQFFVTPATSKVDTSASTRVTSLSVFALLLASLTVWLS